MPADNSEQSEANTDVARIVNLVTGIASSLVDSPERVSLRQEHSEGLVRLVLSIAAGDLDKVLGEKGRTARSLRTLVTAAASRIPGRVSLDILEAV